MRFYHLFPLVVLISMVSSCSEPETPTVRFSDAVMQMPDREYLRLLAENCSGEVYSNMPITNLQGYYTDEDPEYPNSIKTNAGVYLLYDKYKILESYANDQTTISLGILYDGKLNCNGFNFNGIVIATKFAEQEVGK